MTLIDLLTALQQQPGTLPPPARPLPVPYAPAPDLGPLSTDTTLARGALNPEPVPPRFIQPGPVDEGFVSQYTGQQPTPPAPLSRVQRVANAFTGFGEGMAGRGGEFISRLQEPQRRYEAQQERFEERRMRGIELAERRSERDADAANRANEAAYEREYKVWLSKNADRSDEAKTRMAQMFILERDTRAARLEAEREQRRERLQQEREADRIEERYFTASKNRQLSRELGRHWAGLSNRPLSPAAARLDAQLAGFAQDRMRREVGGGTAGRGASSAAQDALMRFDLSKQALIGALQRGDAKSAAAFREAMNRHYKTLARYPAQIELATTNPEWPFARMRNAQPAPAPQQLQPQAKTITRAEMQALGVTEAQARAEGYTITP